MTLKLPKLPKVRIPFLGASKEQAGEGAFDDAFGDDDDDREPSGARRVIPWIGVVLAYLAVIGGVGGTVYYLSSQSDMIQAEMMALRPSHVVAPLPGADGAEMADGDASSTDAVEGAPAAPAEPDPELEPEVFQTLHPHPNPSLVEETPIGPLPKIAEDGRMPWRVYARPFNSLETRPKVAIVVSDLGLNTALAEEAIQLPGAMTLAFASYSPGLSDWIDKARDGGHEVLLTLPMEPYDFPRSDPGPYALMGSFDETTNVDKLRWVMSRATGYVGLVNFQGSKFNSSADLIRPVLAEMGDRGLLYLDSGETPVSVVPLIAEDVNMPAVKVDIVLDNPPDRGSIVAQLARLEARARARGVAVGLAHPFPASLNRLRVWSRELAAKGIALIPLSAVVAGGYQAADNAPVTQ